MENANGLFSKRLTCDVCEKQSRVTAKFQIGHHVWLLCHSHVLVGVPLEQLEHRLDEWWNRWPDLDLGHCVVGFHGCIPFHGRGTTLTRHAMILRSLHTHFADADADADIVGITQMGSMAPTTGGKALTFEKRKRDRREKKILMLLHVPRPISLGE